jgi:hypothetical protein
MEEISYPFDSRYLLLTFFMPSYIAQGRRRVLALSARLVSRDISGMQVGVIDGRITWQNDRLIY